MGGTWARFAEKSPVQAGSEGQEATLTAGLWVASFCRAVPRSIQQMSPSPAACRSHALHPERAVQRGLV